MKFALNLPLGSVSFGQVSVSLLREMHKRKLSPNLFPIGGTLDLSPYENVDPEFAGWIQECVSRAHLEHNRKIPIFKLWHLHDSFSSYSDHQFLLSFYELDSPTPMELNYAKNSAKILFSSEYTRDLFKSFGLTNVDYLPLAFDARSFFKKDKVYFPNRITFNICGKFEKRKHHLKAIREWINLFGGNPQFSLQCATYNPFFNEEQNAQVEHQILGGNKVPNVSFLKFMPTDAQYNDYLNSADVVIGASGGEGWGLPEFQSCAIGKHAVILNCNGYKSWANPSNSTLFEPSSKVSSLDGIFFKGDQPYNQGNIFDFSTESYHNALKESVKKVSVNRLNEAGLALQQEFSVEKFCDRVLSLL